MKMTSARQLRSTVHDNGTLSLTLTDAAPAPPAPDEIVVRIQAAPINPSDLRLLLGPADLGSVRASGSPQRPVLTFDIPARHMPGVRHRAGLSLPVGNEGAGTVVAGGREAEGWIGRRVAVLAGATYADLRIIRAGEAIALPEGASPADGAAVSVNPLTALGFVETARDGGHGAIVHTAAASALGQMLNRICLADNIPLINIVRSAEQVALLRATGAPYAIDSRAVDFRDQLTAAVAKTGATVAFDAIGGGCLGNQMLQAMEDAAARTLTAYSRYGSSLFKQLYVYGNLDPTPTLLDRDGLGFRWSVSGWLLTPFLEKAGAATVARLRQRILRELTTTFATHYTRTISLAEALDPDVLRAYARKATGEKFLIDPTLG